MPKLIRIFLVILSIATGALFLYSSFTKAYPIAPFEYTMVEYLHLPWFMAAIAARLLVGLEAAIGALLVLHLFGRNNTVLKTAFALLIVFSIYLIALWAKAGNNINCGCFGDAIWMSPSASLIKNGVLLLVVGMLIRFHRGLSGRWVQMATPAVFIIFIVLPFLLYAIPDQQPSWLRKDRYKADLSPLYTNPGKDTTADAVRYPQAPAIDLTKGKYIIAFLSPSCPHCRIAARKMQLMKLSNPALPFFLVMGGTNSDLTEFWKESKTKGLPYCRLDKVPFLHFTGGVFPHIIWVNDGWVEATSTYNTMNQSEIEKWLK